MRILVYGAGSLGSLIGGLLAAEHDVLLLGREPHVRAIEADGLAITGELERTVHPTATTALDGAEDVDLAVVTVKSYDTGAAAKDLASSEPDAVLSLQNGMGNEAILADRLTSPVLAGTTTFGARLREPGLVECTGVGSVTIGPHGDAPLSAAKRAGEAFQDADVETTVVRDPRTHLWEKLAVNAGINPVTALARVPNGAIADGPLEPIATRAAVETAGVARTRGVDLTDEMAREAVRSVAVATSENRSSMLVDVTRGRRTEIDAISGYVLEHAEAPVPMTETMAALVRGWEAGEGLR